jgi:hypothetical protein
MSYAPEPAPWFEFKIEDTQGAGVDVKVLSRLLSDLSSAFYEIARSKLGRGGRTGPRTQQEDAIAAIRILQVQPGSVILRAAPPLTTENVEFPFGQLGADDVARDFIEEVQRISRHEPTTGRAMVRRRVATVIRDVSAIGKSAELTLRPHISGETGLTEFRATLDADSLESLVVDSIKTLEPRRLSGHAYMVDIEPGKWRVRLKLPDGHDVTLDVAEDVASTLSGALDQPIEVESVEERAGDVISRRMAVSVQLLPASSGSDKPPKGIDQLEREQNATVEHPDYSILATSVWETEDDFEEFDEYLKKLRGSLPA